MKTNQLIALAIANENYVAVQRSHQAIRRPQILVAIYHLNSQKINIVEMLMICASFFFRLKAFSRSH